MCVGTRGGWVHESRGEAGDKQRVGRPGGKRQGRKHGKEKGRGKVRVSGGESVKQTRRNIKVTIKSLLVILCLIIKAAVCVVSSQLPNPRINHDRVAVLVKCINSSGSYRKAQKINTQSEQTRRSDCGGVAKQGGDGGGKRRVAAVIAFLAGAAVWEVRRASWA